jgi:hypothetical protein
MDKEKTFRNKRNFLAVFSVTLMLLVIFTAYGVFALQSNLINNDLQGPNPTPNPTVTTPSTSKPSPHVYTTLTPTPYETPTPIPMPGLPSPPPAYLSLSMNPLTVQINEQVSGNITTNIHDFNASVTYINTQSGETKQTIVPCVNHSGQFSVILTQTGSYSFIAQFNGKQSNPILVTVTG